MTTQFSERLVHNGEKDPLDINPLIPYSTRNVMKFGFNYPHTALRRSYVGKRIKKYFITSITSIQNIKREELSA